ncbi:MAG TPA: LytTR family DNA-binding domain-containing protein [Rhodothermales bacterium]|nr:LytTR family DNA-binding domain-containing protein [Rhodothermales bacterium]
MSPLQTLIVDDEPLGRERIRTLLASRKDVQVAGEAKDGDEAVGLLQSTDFDLAFLDIQMPHRSGFEVIRAVGVEQMPPVVFVTAYDAYALQAFEVHALDYLLKPFEPERFHEALDRVLALIQKQNRTDLDARVQQLLDDLEPAPEPIQRLMIKTHQRIQFIRTEDIDWIEAAGNYVKLHVGSQTHLLRQTMTSLEDRLDSNRFLRIHRSTIVNLDRVKDLKAMMNGEYEVRLQDGTRLTLSRGYRQVLDQFT